MFWLADKFNNWFDNLKGAKQPMVLLAMFMPFIIIQSRIPFKNTLYYFVLIGYFVVLLYLISGRVFSKRNY